MKTFIPITIFLLTLSCKNQPLLPDAGLVELKLELYDTTGDQRSNPNLTYIQKIWYEDSFAIEEIKSLRINTDTNKITTTEFIIDNYRLNDFRKKIVYVFKTFSDTAKIKDTYLFTDKRVLTGGWGFNEKKEFEHTTTPVPLKDTLENNILIKRLQLQRPPKDNSFTSIVSFRCNTPPFFDMDPKLSAQVGCPCIGIFNYRPDKQIPSNLSAFYFLRDYLLPEEKAVFTAWRKKIRQNKTP